MPSRQIQHNKSQLILTLDLEHNRTSGLQVAEKLTQCFDIGNFFAVEGDDQITRLRDLPLILAGPPRARPQGRRRVCAVRISFSTQSH